MTLGRLASKSIRLIVALLWWIVDLNALIFALN